MGRMYVLEVWMRLRVFMSVWALYGEANAPYWKTIKRPNSSHLTLLDTKTALYKLPKNRWVIVHFEIFGPVRNKLLVTVFLDDPVSCIIATFFFIAFRFVSLILSFYQEVPRLR